MRFRLAPALGLLLGSFLPTAASAYPIFDVVSSEVLSVDPPRVKTTFTITEYGGMPPGGCGWCCFMVTALDPGSATAPHFFDCESPEEGWFDCQVEDDVAVHFGHGQLPEVPGTYSIVTDRAAPCVSVEYICVVLMGSPPPPTEACLTPDMPVPTVASTWGAIKSRYR